MRFTWANHSDRRILVSNLSVTCNSLCEFYTLDWFLHVWAPPWNGLRRLHVLKDTTQMWCVWWSTLRWSSSQLFITPLIRLPWSIVTLVGHRSSFMLITFLQNSYCTLSSFFLDLSVGCSSTWRCAYEHFSPTTTLDLVEQAFWRVPLFTKWVVASSFEVILAKPSRHSTTGTFPLGLRVLDASLILLHELGDGFGCVIFARFIDIVAETTIVSCTAETYYLRCGIYTPRRLQ